jgi:hypothetical protein
MLTAIEDASPSTIRFVRTESLEEYGEGFRAIL